MESITLDREVLALKDDLAPRYARMIYNGYWFSPERTLLRRLIDEFEGPVTGTSANISGFPSCSNAEQVMKQLGSRVPLVLDTGETGGTQASTIVELNGDTWRIGREGAIPVAEIEKALE